MILGLPPFMKARAAKARCRLFDSLHDIEDEPEGVPEVATARVTRLHLAAGNLKLQSGTRRVGDVERWNERTQGVLVSVHVEPQSSAVDFQLYGCMSSPIRGQALGLITRRASDMVGRIWSA